MTDISQNSGIASQTGSVSKHQFQQWVIQHIHLYVRIGHASMNCCSDILTL